MNKNAKYALIFVGGAVSGLVAHKKLSSIRVKSEGLFAEALNDGIKAFKETLINGVSQTLWYGSEKRTGRTADNYIITDMKKHGATEAEVQDASTIISKKPKITQAEKAALNYYIMKYVQFGGD